MALILVICFQGYVILKDRWPGITYIEYSYAGRHCLREVDWCFIDKKIVFDTDVAEAVMLIEDKTQHEAVVIRSWKILFKKL
jgi:hypothetical protein